MGREAHLTTRTDTESVSLALPSQQNVVSTNWTICTWHVICVTDFMHDRFTNLG